MLFPILSKNETYEKMIDKLDEERDELNQSLFEHKIKPRPDTRNNLVAETLDCIQVCIGILNQAEKEGVDLNQAGYKHLLKLTNRQNFTFEGYISLRRVE